jgi:hypothetical protein
MVLIIQIPGLKPLCSLLVAFSLSGRHICEHFGSHSRYFQVPISTMAYHFGFLWSWSIMSILCVMLIKKMLRFGRPISERIPFHGNSTFFTSLVNEHYETNDYFINSRYFVFIVKCAKSETFLYINTNL